MALEKGFVSVSFARGVDKYTDKKVVEAGRLLESSNARFVTRETMTKRFGFDSLGDTALDGTDPSSAPSIGPLADAVSLGEYKDELLVFTSDGVFSRSDEQNRFVKKGFVNEAVVDIKKVASSVENQIEQSMDVRNNLEAYVWIEGKRACYFSLYDKLSNAYIANKVLVKQDSTNGVRGSRVYFLNNKIFVFYISEGLKYRVFDQAEAGQFDAEVTVNSNSRFNFDIDRIDQKTLVFISDNNNDTTLLGGRINNLGVIFTESVAIDPKTALVAGSGLSSVTTAQCTYLGIAHNPINDQVGIIYKFVTVNGSPNAGNYIIWVAQFQVLNAGLDVVVGPEAVVTVLSSNSFEAYLPVAIVDLAEDDYRLFVSRSEGSGFQFNVLRENIVVYEGDNSGNVALLSNQTVFNAKMVSKPTKVDDDLLMVIETIVSGITRWDSTAPLATDEGIGDASYLLISVKEGTIGKIISRFSANKAAVYRKVLDFSTSSPLTARQYETNINLNALVLSEGGNLNFAFAELFRFIASQSQEPGLFSQGLVVIRSTTSAAFKFDDPLSLYSEETDNTLLVTGGMVYEYDANTSTELNFVHPPSVAQIAVQVGLGSGVMPLGQYVFFFVYEWYDAQGNVHRSAPSRPSVYISTDADVAPKFSIRSLNFGEKIKNAERVLIVPYRTEVNGSIAYRIPSDSFVLSPADQERNSIINNAGSDVTVLIISADGSEEALLGTSDSELIANEVLYTQSGALENFPPPPSKAITYGKNRAFVVSADDENRVLYSKQKISRDGIAFNPDLFVQVNSRYGDLSALAVMDEKLIAFAKRGIFYIAGDGPNNLGLNNTFTDPIEIATNVGAEDQNSLVLMPDGLMFKSEEKGIYLLNRALQTQYVGADVSEFNDAKILAATNSVENDEVRFLLNNGKVLVYNHFLKDERGVGPWLIWDGFFGKDAVRYKNRYVYLRQNNEVWLENRNSFLDAGQVYGMSIETSWIKMQGIQNFQRVWRAYILGNFKSPHRVRTQIAYDYEDFYREDLTWDAASEFVVDLYGTGEYGSVSPYGGPNEGVYQFRAHMPRQKCEAIKFKFTEIPEPGTNEGFEMTNLTLEIASKRSGNKMREGKNV